MTSASNNHVESPEHLAETYPELFTKAHIQAWRALFDDRAVFIRTESGQPYRLLGIDEAMPEQIEYTEENPAIHETWENVSTQKHGGIAVVSADYTLVAGNEIRRGVDVAMLARHPDHGWRIVSLAYQQHPLTMA